MLTDEQVRIMIDEVKKNPDITNVDLAKIIDAPYNSIRHYRNKHGLPPAQPGGRTIPEYTRDDIMADLKKNPMMHDSVIMRRYGVSKGYVYCLRLNTGIGSRANNIRNCVKDVVKNSKDKSVSEIVDILSENGIYVSIGLIYRLRIEIYGSDVSICTHIREVESRIEHEINKDPFSTIGDIAKRASASLHTTRKFLYRRSGLKNLRKWARRDKRLLLKPVSEHDII